MECGCDDRAFVAAPQKCEVTVFHGVLWLRSHIGGRLSATLEGRSDISARKLSSIELTCRQLDSKPGVRGHPDKTWSVSSPCEVHDTVVGPAIGNAIFAAVGARVRHLPIRSAAILRALANPT